MPYLSCGGKDVMAVILFQDKCPTVPLQLFVELFSFMPARYSVQGNDRKLTYQLTNVSIQICALSEMSMQVLSIIETRIELGAPKPSHSIQQHELAWSLAQF
jgi:hypothetical protein